MAPSPPKSFDPARDCGCIDVRSVDMLGLDATQNKRKDIQTEEINAYPV